MIMALLAYKHLRVNVNIKQQIPGCAQGCCERLYLGPPWVAIVFKAATWNKYNQQNYASCSWIHNKVTK